MDWSDLIKQNFVTVIAVLGTLLAGLGSGFLASLISKKFELRKARFEWQKEYQTQNLVQPIISYIDETFALMENIYWTVMEIKWQVSEHKAEDIADEILVKELDKNRNRLISFREKKRLIKVRVRCFYDDELNHAFDEFMKKYGEFANLNFLNNTSIMFNKIQEAVPFATTIFSRLNYGLEKLLN